MNKRLHAHSTFLSSKQGGDARKWFFALCLLLLCVLLATHNFWNQPQNENKEVQENNSIETGENERGKWKSISMR